MLQATIQASTRQAAKLSIIQKGSQTTFFHLRTGHTKLKNLMEGALRCLKIKIFRYVFFFSGKS